MTSKKHSKMTLSGQQLIKFCQEGWPTRVYGTLKKYSALAPEIAMEEEILMRANRIVIPAELQKERLNNCTSHQEVPKKSHVHAISMVARTQLEQIVRDCPDVKYHSSQPIDHGRKLPPTYSNGKSPPTY